MITPAQWEVIEEFRKGVEGEYAKTELSKPERIPAYQETVGVLKESLEKYGLEPGNTEQTYFMVAGMLSSISFIGQYINTVCPDPHTLGHIGEGATFLGYLIRELCFDADAPLVSS